jgi:hypothetical protein
MPIVSQKVAIVPVVCALWVPRLVKMGNGGHVWGLLVRLLELMARGRKNAMGRTMTAMARSMMAMPARIAGLGRLVKMENVPPQNADLVKQNAKSPGKNNALT